jgi:branched-chain amino acid aminotransferase
VACATAANVFAVLPDGIIATPPESDGALPGIVRGVLLARARNKGLIVEERVLARHDIEGATLVLTNSLIGVAPAQLEGQSAPPREMFNRLRSCYEEALAEDLQERARAS